MGVIEHENGRRPLGSHRRDDRAKRVEELLGRLGHSLARRTAEADQKAAIDRLQLVEGQAERLHQRRRMTMLVAERDPGARPRVALDPLGQKARLAVARR